MKWDYLQPVKIYFGKGRVQEIKKIAQELWFCDPRRRDRKRRK